MKLKEKAKGLWTTSADLGLGYDDALLWDNSINVMYFGKRRQHVLFYGNENTGSTSDITAQHYGGSGLGASVLTEIMSAGSSPIGNSLRNNRHTVNLNNLSKLSDTKQLHYNLSYKYDLHRRSSYSQTTYILPEADVRIMSEDISERHNLNDAHVELEYEDNADKHFLSNKLELAGQWMDGHGTVASNDSHIDQQSDNRNLGLQNRTRWAHRTESGGGFELNSTHTVQTTPQELSVSGGMEARQEVNITRVSTSNDFALLKDLRRNRWTIVPSAGLDVNYVGLKSVLKAQTSDNGVMDYVRAQGSVGAILRYVKNEFRMTFNLPLSLTHTNVIGDTNVTRLRISPSASMLWKATDYWTLSGDAGYGTSETPWSQLITCYLMSNYRTVSRYVANLSDSQRLYANLKLNYKDILNEFFAYIQGSASRSWSDIVYGTTIDESAHTIIQAVNMPNSSNNYG
ncbi:MAG: TonB-dependent receptor, partial [Bacteroidaceae bacterium]|nr:TonB-dependent receptor [Bacteroidaceae bacterium]